eukprot:s1938_g21.t1
MLGLTQHTATDVLAQVFRSVTCDYVLASLSVLSLGVPSCFPCVLQVQESAFESARSTPVVEWHLPAHVVPPLPGVFGNLQDAPKFLEDPESFKHADLFPVFAGLKPLILRPQGSASGQPAQVSNLPRKAGDFALTPSQGLGMATRCFDPFQDTVIVGLHECLLALNPGSKLIGFLGGPEGLLQGRCKELTAKEINASLNLGSWKLLSHGSCRDGSYEKERRKEEAIAAAKVCQEQRIILDDLSWAATLATCFVEEELCKHVNLYVPRYLAVTLGFDTARRLLSEVAGNIFVDSLSSNKYWHFIRCGEDALTLEVALQTRCTFSVLTSTAGMTDANENETNSKESLGLPTPLILFGALFAYAYRWCDHG